MTKFEQIGINYQYDACSIAEAQRSFEISCECCVKRGMCLDCDKCQIAFVHNLVVSTFEHMERKHA